MTFSLQIVFTIDDHFHLVILTTTFFAVLQIRLKVNANYITTPCQHRHFAVLVEIILFTDSHLQRTTLTRYQPTSTFLTSFTQTHTNAQAKTCSGTS